jgi:L-asparaginase
LSSLELASLWRDGNSVIREVCIFFDYQLFRANRAKKIESENFNAFHSENYSILAEVGIEIEMKEHYLWRNSPNQELKFNSDFSEDVFIWKIFPGMRIRGIADTLIKAGFKGIILETFGSGNTQTSKEFLNEIKMLTENGAYILNVSQCMGGSVRHGRYVGSKKMQNLGVISGKDITSEAAVVKMMHVLGSFKDRDKIVSRLSDSICGELSR